MHGISPRSSMMTLLQIQTSMTISEAVPEFPTTVSDLVSQFGTPELSLAATPLELNDEGELIQNETNQRILSTIKLALSSPSSECAASIKTSIFKNATKVDQWSRHTLKPYLVQIINRIKQEGGQINLDDVCLENLNLDGGGEGAIDLSSMSAQRAVFSNIWMMQSKLERADFTGARFINTHFYSACISKANITGAEFDNVTSVATVANELTGNQSTILEYSETCHSLMTGTVDIHLYLKDQSACPDTNTLTLRPKIVLRRT